MPQWLENKRKIELKDEHLLGVTEIFEICFDKPSTKLPLHSQEKLIQSLQYSLEYFSETSLKFHFLTIPKPVNFQKISKKNGNESRLWRSIDRKIT